MSAADRPAGQAPGGGAAIRVEGPLFREWLLEEARALGIPIADTIDLEPVLGPRDSAPLAPRAPAAPDARPPAPVAPDARWAASLERFDRWLASGHQGEMHYLARGRDRRADPRRLMPEARSMLCVAVPYPRRPAGALRPEQGPRYARYLQGPDYHEWLSARLTELMLRVRERLARAEGRAPVEAKAGAAAPTEASAASGAAVAESDAPAPARGARPGRIAPPAPRLGGPADPVLRWKVCVDTSAVLERAWAALAGLGWIGKNSLLIHPREGSYLFLGEVLLDRETGRGPSPLPDFCGHCSRCLEACPTRAFVAPRELDSRRCIAYATLEKRGSWPETTSKTGGWVAGCDVCQEVCPFNLKPVARELAESPSLESDATALRDWASLLEETPEAYRERVARSALNRVRPEDFQRNLARARAELRGPSVSSPHSAGE